MIATLTQMRITGWRRTPNALRWIGIPLGLFFAVMTVVLGSNVASVEAGGVTLTLVFAGWLAVWIVGPIQSGGADLLRPEWFAMHPIAPRRLAAGMLTASFAGVGAVVTLIAVMAFPVYGSQLGVVPVLVGLAAGLLTTVLMVIVSKLVAEVLGAAAKSRVVLEVTSIQYGLFVALMFVGWFALGQLGQLADGITGIGSALPDWVATLLLALPSGWGVGAVEAAGSGNWLASAAFLIGLAVSSWASLVLWAKLLERRTTGASLGAKSKRYRQSQRLLPATPLGAVVGKDARTWTRDPRRGVEVRSSLWAAFFITFAGWVFAPEFLAFSGVIVVLIGAMATVNIYAMDGTALWYTLLTPGAIRADIRGRQLAWLTIFIPASLIPTAIGLAIAPQSWALPWVLTLLPALLGAGAGLIVLLSIIGLVPETDAHKRSGNPAETGADATGLYFIMLFSVPLLAAPPGVLLALSVIRESPALAWWAVAVGTVIGIAYAWGFGAIAIRKLDSQGVEYLQKMRVGPQMQERVTVDEMVKVASSGWAVGLLTTVSMISIFPQGVVPLIFTLTGAVEDNPWWLAQRFPLPWSLVVASGFIIVGLFAGWWAIRVNRKNHG